VAMGCPRAGKAAWLWMCSLKFTGGKLCPQCDCVEGWGLVRDDEALRCHPEPLRGMSYGPWQLPQIAGRLETHHRDTATTDTHIRAS
jgi:hypothetical protein